MVRSTAQHACPPPVELIAFGFRVGLALEFPAADACVEFAKGAFFCARAAAWRLIWPFHHGRVLRVVPGAAGFEQEHIGAGFGEHVRSHAAAGTGPDDDDVVDETFGSDHLY